MTLFRDLGTLNAVLEDLWCGSSKAFCIELAASAVEGEIIERMFPFNVKFDCPRTVLTWPAALSDAELAYGSPKTHQCYLGQCLELLRKLPGTELEARIAHVILLNPRVHNTVPAVARRLNLSVRTLQRRLHDEGLTFRAILDRTQSEIAKRWLRETSLSVAQVSEKLGYADRASFDLAFTRWSGRSPRRFREEVRAEGVVMAA